MEQEKNTLEAAKHEGQHPASVEAMATKPTLSVPVAIIVAGVLIAGAILTNGLNGNPSAKTPGTPATLLKKATIAEEVGLNKKKFAECLASGKYKDVVEAQYQSGVKAGVRGTPFSIIIAKSGEMYPINGAQPFDSVKQIIESALKGEKGVKEKINLDPVTEKDHIFGNPQAEMVIVEYSDLECPFCKRFHETMIQIMSEYGKEGKVAWVYRHFPLDAIHSKARREAEAVECAGELGGNDKFWAYVNKLVEITPSNNQLDASLL
jgi:protein-disulfide isomerase